MINNEIELLSKNKSVYEIIDNCLKEIAYSYKIEPEFDITKVLRLL
jgi:hypothetical protein